MFGSFGKKPDLCSRNQTLTIKHYIIMLLKERFNGVDEYVSFIENCVEGWFIQIDYEQKYNFIGRFANADYEDDIEHIDVNSLMDNVYNQLKNEYKNDYKALTELVMVINTLSWVNSSFVIDGFVEREALTEYYSNLYYEARDYFYDVFGENEEACDYFFNMTD